MIQYKCKRFIRILTVILLAVVLILATYTNNNVQNFLNSYFTIASTDSNKSGTYVHFIDVGCGDSILITNNSNNILIDTGNEFLRSKSLEYLKDNNIDKLDILMLTHSDKDHIGSAVDIIKEISVGKIIVPKGFKEKYDEKELVYDILQISKDMKIEIEEITAYQTFNFCDCNIEILSPMQEYDNSNDNSIVSKLTYKEVSFMLTGDIVKAEDDIVKSYKDIECDVLKVAHHGSRYSSSQEFIRAVNPKYAVISVGDNSYGLPSYEIIDLLEQNNIKVYRTDISGTVVFYTDGKNIKNYEEK